MKTRLSLEAAAAAMREKTVPLRGEVVETTKALGRTLGLELLSPIFHPPFARGPIAGYALRALDVLGATKETPVSLQVVDAVKPGEPSRSPVGPGQAVRVMVGSHLPAGADCVLPLEEAVQDGERILVSRSLHGMENYKCRGADMPKGAGLLPAGTRLDAAAIGLLLSAGVTAVPVWSRPRVFLLAMGGDSVRPLITPLPEHRVYAAVGPMLQARMEALGVTACEYQKLGDDAGAVSEVSFIAAEKNDLLITLGGIGAQPEEGILPGVLARQNAKTMFHGIDLEQGNPVRFTTLYQKPILSLPGDPVEALIAFELLARPLLAAMTGEECMLPKREKATLEGKAISESAGRRILPGRVEKGVASVVGGHAGAQLKDFVGCNCLVDLPAGVSFGPGAQVEAVLL